MRGNIKAKHLLQTFEILEKLRSNIAANIAASKCSRIPMPSKRQTTRISAIKFKMQACTKQHLIDNSS